MKTENFSNENDVYEQLTLSQIVLKNYKAAAIFEKYSLDYCCKGKKSFSDACEEKKLNAEKILDEIKNSAFTSDNSDLRFNEWELDFLVDYTVNNHHKYIRKAIPVISFHAEKIASKHGGTHPETVEVNRIFSIVAKDLIQHLMKEEQILFPYIKYLVKTEKQNLVPERPYFGTVVNPITMMDADHTGAGDSLYQIRELTNNYNPPEDACPTFTAYYKELQDFEEDLHKHVHLENNIIFPGAIEKEKEMFSKTIQN